MTETSQKKAKILIVDDQDANILLLERILKQDGYTCYRSLNDSRQAVSVCQEFQPDLVLLDLMMPHLDGVAVMEQLRPLTEGTYLPILVLTADVGAEARRRALAAGAKDFLTKPFDAIEVMLRIKNLLETRLLYQRLARRADRRIQQQAALLDRANDAIMVRDMHDRILYWNQGAERLYGWKAAEVMGQKAAELLHSAAVDFVAANQAVMKDEKWAGEMTQQTKDGRELIVASRWTLMRDEEGLSKLVINTDITEKKKLEAQHLRAQRMENLGVLASGIAHDLNNVLTPIMMALDFLKMKLPDPASQPLLKTLQASAERGAAMVQQVLSFARGTEGKHVPISLRSASKECQRMLEHTLPKAIRLEFSLPSDLWLISADATQISQVLMNLCVNARDAMPQGGCLAVTAQNQTVDKPYAQMHAEARPGPYVVLTVSDTGTGMPAEILGKIFDPFFTTKKQGEGTGLGLSTVLEIVKGHGGFINVDSKVGEGTRFSVYLPAAETTAVEPASHEQNSAPRGKGELILVVDDELAIGEITKATLETHGYRALTAGDGAEALAALMENRGDIKLVLTDMSMPVMDGAATIRALRKIEPRLPIIAVTGLNVGGQAGVAADVQAFLRKPYTADKLLRILREVLDRGRGEW